MARVSRFSILNLGNLSKDFIHRFAASLRGADFAGQAVAHRLRFLRSLSGALGSGIVAGVLLVALVGRYLAPHDPSAPIGVPPVMWVV